MEKSQFFIVICSDRDSTIQKNIEFLAACFRKKAAGIAGGKVQGIPTLTVTERTYRVIGTDNGRSIAFLYIPGNVSYLP